MRDREAAVREEWAIPAGVVLAPDVPLDEGDPARETPTRRRCCALTKAGQRCPTTARADSILCTAHAGRLDSSAGGHARAQSLAAVKAEAEERMVAAAMGARAGIRSAILERSEQMRRIVHKLMDDAEAGNARAQQTLAVYITQGFGSPAVQAGESTPPDDATAVAHLSDDDLRALAFPSNQAA